MAAEVEVGGGASRTAAEVGMMVAPTGSREAAVEGPAAGGAGPELRHASRASLRCMDSIRPSSVS